MRILGLVLVGAIAALHVYIAYFEIFAWETKGPSVFSSFPQDLFSKTVALAINQGFYNAFLAIGLIWSLVIQDKKWQSNVAICFLLFVATAGVVGALTASTRIVFVQTVPAVIAMILLLSARIRSTKD
ncbi:MAG: hypothetical protein COA78_28265 [Blastopirellula sp.]|nr:MAG: hypothetical protein COA78_28265 [Blastopirellula sp.]